MRVCVQGLWHLGSVISACLASSGHYVVGFDSNKEVIRNLKKNKAPLFEPELNTLIACGTRGGQLRFTDDIRDAYQDIDILWITYDTPVNDEDIANIDFVIDQVKSSINFMPDGLLVLISSQLPVGTISLLEDFVKDFYSQKNLSFACSPENLRLGRAINVFLRPDRIVVGIRSCDDKKKLEQLLLPITDKIEWMSVESAEMTKHAINAFLATSVTFVNEIAAICELVGADAKEVERGLKSEGRIGPKAYLSPGGPFAGGTLARDIEFLGKISHDWQLSTPLLSSVRLSNDVHKKWVQQKLLKHFSCLRGVRVAVWGLTYKAGTNTLRRSLSVELVDWLLEYGAQVQVYDPVVKELPINWANQVKKCVSAHENIEEMQVLVVGTEWPEFKDAARQLSKFINHNFLIIDANRFLPESIRGTFMSYLSVGSRQVD